MKMPAMKMDHTSVAIVAAIAVGGFLIWRAGSALKDAVPELIDGAGAVVYGSADMVSGVLTGNNAITQGARTNAYQDAGVLGTLGAATDRILGGVPSQLGEKFGNWLFDVTH